MKTITRTLTLALLIVAGAAAQADELHMKNGSVLIGTLVSAENDTALFETPFAGTITVKEENIARVVTEEKVILMMEDGTVYRDRRIDFTGDQLVATVNGQEPVTFDTRDIKRVNPEPWRLGEGYNWSGSIGVDAEFERGNSDTDEWDIVGTTTWRSLKDRYVFKGDFERDRKDGDKTSDNWELRSKYDRFFQQDPNNYYGAKLRFEYDRFADLDLRTIVGPHLGRQFFETPLITLHAEFGPVWVDEQFNNAEDNDFPGALWEVGASSDILGFGLTVYIDHDGIFNFDETDDLILNTTIGIKMPIAFGFEAGFEAEYEYDGGAVQDVDDLDTTYTMRIGYAW